MRSRSIQGAVSIVFDGDDTLWSTEPLYDSARAKARELVVEAGLDGDEWETIERQVDVERVSTHGFTKDRFPGSCVQAYQRIARRDGALVDPAVVTRIRRVAQQVFASRPQLMPHALETLARLHAARFPLALITKGDAEVQQRRIKQSGVGKYFAVIEVVPHKSAELITRAVLSLGASPAESWMVGNSIPSDVIPALEAGLRVIWLDAPVWEYERVASFLHERVTSAVSLREVPGIVASNRSRLEV